MTKIRIESSVNGVIERTFDDDDEDCGWIEIARNFGLALAGLGYYLPDDWTEYLDRKQEQTNRADNIFKN